MNVINVLKKFGILHAGTDSYKGRGQLLSAFYGPDGKQKATESETEKGAASTGADADAETAADTQKPPTRGGSHTGRKIFFWAALIFGILCVLIVLATVGISTWSVLTLLAWAGFSYYAGNYAFTGFGRTGVAGGLFVGAILLTFVFLVIGAPGTQMDTSSGLQYEQATWASVAPDGTLNPVDGREFVQGNTAAFVFLNVDGFEKGDDGLYWYDLNISVASSEGEMLMDAEHILGEDGHRDLEGGIARSPYTFINTTNMEPGEYKVTLTILDRVGDGQAQVERTLVVTK